MAENYAYFQIKPQAVCLPVLHNAQEQMCQFETQVSLSASAADLNLFKNSPSTLYCATSLERAFDASFWYSSIFSEHLLFHRIKKLCNEFSLGVDHSKFSSLSSVFIPFMWFIKGLFSGFGIYVSHINLLLLKLLAFHKMDNLTEKYHLFIKTFINLPFLALYFGKLHILQSSVIAYNHSNQGMSFIKNKIKNRYILKSWKNKMHLSFTQKCIQDFFDINSIFIFNYLQYA